MRASATVRSNRSDWQTSGTFRHPDVKTDAAFFQIAHNAARRIQSEGTAARQHNSVDDLRRRQRLEQLALAGGRPAAANIQPRRGTVFAQQEHRAAGARRRVLSLADLGDSGMK